MPSRLNYVNRNKASFDVYYDGDSPRFSLREVGEVEVTPSLLVSLKSWHRLKDNGNDFRGSFHMPDTSPNVSFNGQYVTFVPVGGALVHAAATVDSGDLSVSLWFKRSSTSLLRLWSQNTVIFNRQRINVSNTTIRYEYPTQVDISQSIDDNWHHLVVTHIGTDIKVYFDGALVGSDSGSLNLTDIHNTQIGSGPTSGSSSWRGDIKHVGVWNRGITADEVLILYGDGIPFDPTA